MVRDVVSGKKQAMEHIDIARAWKDEDYRLSLSEAERAHLVPNPVGVVELSDEELAEVTGALPQVGCTCGCLTAGVACGGEPGA